MVYTQSPYCQPIRKTQQGIFLQKYLSLFIKTALRETETGGPIYRPFLNLRCDSIFKALHFRFLDKKFSTGDRLPTGIHRPLTGRDSRDSG